MWLRQAQAADERAAALRALAGVQAAQASMRAHIAREEQSALGFVATWQGGIGSATVVIGRQMGRDEVLEWFDNQREILESDVTSTDAYRRQQSGQ